MSTTLTFTFAVLAILLSLAGIVGCIVPIIPGPPISWIGLLLVYVGKFDGIDGEPMSLWVLLLCLLVVVIVTVLDYIVPPKFTKITGGHKASSWGSLIGMIVGLFFSPVGLVIGCLLGAFLGELIVHKSGARASFFAALGAFAGFMVSVGMKLTVSAALLCLTLAYIFT